MLRVLMLYDVQGWAWWHRVHNIRKVLTGRVVVEGARMTDPFDHDPFDFVVVFEARYWRHVAHIPPDKLIIGCSCPRLVEELLCLLRTERVAAALVNNRSMHDLVSKEFRCFCCPNGVDDELFYPPSVLPKELTACWVGNTNALVDKGLDLIRDACKAASVPIIVVDKGCEMEQGTLLSHAELRDAVYHRSSVYICASEYEGTPNPALEALACGLVVISTPVGNMPEVIENGVNGFLVRRTVEALGNALAALQGSDLTEMARRARQSILAGWTWQQRAGAYERMFLDLARSADC